MITTFTGRCKDGIWRQRFTYTTIGKEVEVEIALNPGESKRLYVEQPIRQRGKRGGRKHKK